MISQIIKTAMIHTLIIGCGTQPIMLAVLFVVMIKVKFVVICHNDRCILFCL